MTNKSVLYSLINGSFEDISLHTEMSLGFLEDEEFEKAIIRCEKAIKSLGEAKREIQRYGREISHQKMVHFSNQLLESHQKIWQTTQKINEVVKGNLLLFKRSKNLRLNFVAYAYNPSGDLEEHCETSQIS